MDLGEKTFAGKGFNYSVQYLFYPFPNITQLQKDEIGNE